MPSQLIFEQNYPFGEIKGAFRISKEEAKELFNFEMKDGSKGICIYKRKNKWIIRNIPKYRCTSKKEEIILKPKEKIKSKTPIVYIFYYYKGEYSYSIRRRAKWLK